VGLVSKGGSRAAAQRPRAKLPVGSGRLLPTLRLAGGPSSSSRKRRPPGQPKVLVISRGDSELFDGSKEGRKLA
jgi:hypothetical protein